MNVGILMNSKLMEVVGLFQKTLAMIEDIQYTVAI